jgi:hypothetical protein
MMVAIVSISVACDGNQNGRNTNAPPVQFQAPPPVPSPSTCANAGTPLAFSCVPGNGNQTCYPTPTGTPYTVSAQITGYGWPDNSPPGAAIAHPVCHQKADGAGTYEDPTSFATEPSNNDKFPYGTLIYVPSVQRYFLREDDCTNSGPAVNSGSNGCSGIWFDVWVGGADADSVQAIGSCEDAITAANVAVTVNPPSGLPVKSGPVFSSGSCNN